MSFIIEKIVYPDLSDLTITETKKYSSKLSSGVLMISEVITNEDNQETEVLVIQQPWKCHPDGSRENFVDETDAAVWLESVKDSFLR
jgi:hypothetical protein